ncbi:MAG: hypothetical protein ACK501_16855 [Planctomycetota bacterium]
MRIAVIIIILLACVLVLFRGGVATEPVDSSPHEKAADLVKSMNAATEVSSAGGTAAVAGGVSIPDRQPAPEPAIDGPAVDSVGGLEAAKARAMEHLASVGLSGDIGHDASLKMLKRFLDNGCKISELRPVRRQVDDWARDRTINPTAMVLSPEDRTRLQDLLDQHAVQMFENKACEYIESMIGLNNAVRSGRFMEFPSPQAGDDGSAMMDKARAAAKFERESDWNIATLPGANAATVRVVVLTPEFAPRYIAAKRRTGDLNASHQYAIRSFFVPR